MTLSPLTRRRLHNFRANRRGFWSAIVFAVLFVVTLFAELIANDRPLVVSYDGHLYTPFLHFYPETTFGGDFETEADYRDPYFAKLIDGRGWILWPPIPYRYDTVITDLDQPAPSPPSWRNLLGTDDQSRDVLARLIYGFRISVLFGLLLTVFSTLIGVAAGAVQGYFGGWVDLTFQRLLEIWGGVPSLYVLIIMSSIIVPSFWMLLALLLLFSWTWPIPLVRAEVLRARNFEYVRAARALGVASPTIIARHVLPNAVVSTLTFLPFQMGGAVTVLTSLDYLGFGLPPGSASLGELLSQGKNNLQAPWLGFTGFIIVGLMLVLLNFVGEAVRDAFDPRKSLG